MENIKVMGIGVISKLGNDLDEIWANLDMRAESTDSHGKIDFESVVPKKKRRRMNRYSEMTVYTTHKALESSHIDTESLDKTKVGTIFSTGYGPMVSNLAFAEMVHEGDQDLCSPTVFANTVSNTCVGHVCMEYGFQGVSTILMGSNNIAYSSSLLRKDVADHIVTGSVEEYCEELYEAFNQKEITKAVPVQEASVTFVLKKSDESNMGYCEIIETKDCNLGIYPLIEKVNEARVKQNLTKLLKQVNGGNHSEIDLIIDSSNGSYFDTLESGILKDIFGTQIPRIDNVKKLFGETLGSSCNVGLLAGALILKNGYVPTKLGGNIKTDRLKTILITGYDVSGNYTATVITKEKS
ncbi:3-oxoacyl-ACP synthase [Enterococcus sp. BWB1-3]|uniref:beta-ketoacyl synthase N-terminal-like domain-containing protein n=1 Tax=unclassified Enterococcus TaxID=2608891 RepID=UPI001923E5C6|nr:MULTISPECIES: beta-ketoacyl synthase N-terminal-like domain-containing protein [unclassified Enterococcus]MBL1228804.1 3-oxoacyl-ACP synthase [Enterococcus sp. BWB1-3]MCB5953729.1 hypothetical protein [Enterococcus sp. CWB-B31]